MIIPKNLLISGIFLNFQKQIYKNHAKLNCIIKTTKKAKVSHGLVLIVELILFQYYFLDIYYLVLSINNFNEVHALTRP